MSSLEDKAREISRPALEAVARVLARWNVSPDWVTNLGLLLTVGVAALAAMGEVRWAGAAYVIAALCDAVDGALARVGGRGSRFGAFLDSTIDRFEEAIVFLGLIIYYARLGGGWEIPIILAATVGSLMVSYTRARAEAVGVACREGLTTRPLRLVIVILGMVLEQVPIALSLLTLMSLFTSFQRIYHVWRMTGGEAGGWGPPKTPFSIPGPADPVNEERGEVR